MKPTLIILIALASLCCVPVMAANVTYPQEYYTLMQKADTANRIHGAGWYDGTATIAVDSVFYELRRQTILMEKQNELLVEQNELMGRLVNATEIKFECKATGYVQQASYWSMDDPIVSPSFNVSNYEYNLEAYNETH